MTLVTIDLGDVAGGHDPDDHVVIRAEAFRESPGGGITSTAEVKIPLVDGVGQAEVEPGPVVVTFRCQAVADTREKRGVVPDEGSAGIEDVIGGAFEYTPPVVNRGLDLIEEARDEALGQVEGSVDAAIDSRVVPLEESVTALGESLLMWESPPGSGLYEIGFKDTLNPQHPGLILYDTFSRVESDLVGSLPDVGDAWAGTAGSWSADGGMARSSTPGRISTDAKSKSAKFSIALHAVSTGSLQTLRICAGGTTDQPYFGVMLIVNVASYATLTVTPYWASPSLAQFGEPLSASPPEGPGTPLDVTVDIDISDRDVTITLTGPSGTVSTTGTIPTDLQAQMGTWATIRSMTQVPGMAVDSVEITTAPYPQIGQ